jgi:hypothetical protein
MIWKCIPLVILALTFSGSFVSPAHAQLQCGTVTSIAFPVDPAVFQIVQDFGVPSPRHQGRYHTGEDYFGGRNASYGQPVRAIADGLVTYSAGNGWGRDGGVVIIQHTFPDGSTYYSQYGHMENGETYPFPERYTCVKGGDIVGMVGNARPAPHLHLEIRSNQPDLPGPGYTAELPTTLGWLKPSQFILNWQTWLSSSVLWHTQATTNLAAPPLELPGYNLLFLDQSRLRYLTPDGRVLWRINLTKPAVGILNLSGSSMLIYADGNMQVVNEDGTLGEIYWQTPALIDRVFPAYSNDLHLLAHTTDNTLVLYDVAAKTVAWRVENVAPIVQIGAGADTFAVLTAANELIYMTRVGDLLDRQQVSEPISLGDGVLAYTTGGVSQLTGLGWTPLLENIPPGGGTSAVLGVGEGQFNLLYTSAPDTTGFSATYLAYYVNGAPVWQYELPNVGGTAELNLMGNVLLVTTTYGNIIALQAETGALCNAVQVYGDRRSILWHGLGEDGVLRVAVADQILGIDWGRFIGGCA